VRNRSVFIVQIKHALDGESSRQQHICDIERAHAETTLSTPFDRMFTVFSQANFFGTAVIRSDPKVAEEVTFAAVTIEKTSLKLFQTIYSQYILGNTYCAPL
jgi:hypothetical protein